MSDAERKSHIPDETLAELTAEKLVELKHERDALNERLFQMDRGDTRDAEERSTLERQIENHDAAADKLTKYRAEMLRGADRDDN